MLFDASRTPLPPLLEVEGFEIRSLREEEYGIWGEELSPACDFGVKDAGFWEIYRPKLLPGGILGAFEKATGRLVASACAQNQECGIKGGLGWVMALPEMRGKKLGAAVVAAAMHRTVEQGHPLMALLTDDFRLPAIKLYLQYNWRPWLYMEDMPQRWKNVCKELGIPPETLEDYIYLPEEEKVIAGKGLF